MVSYGKKTIILNENKEISKTIVTFYVSQTVVIYTGNHAWWWL